MKKLILKGCVLCLIAIAIIIGLIFVSAVPQYSDKLNLLTDSGGYAGFGTEEVDGVLYRITSPTKATKLLIGDSVANQIFSGFETDDLVVATGNQAMTFIWQEFFVRWFIENNPQTADVYIAISPDSLSSVWSDETSYQYVLMPMVKYGYYYGLDAESHEELENIYGRFFMKESVISLIDRSGINRKLFLNGLKMLHPTDTYTKNPCEVSRVPDMYLSRILDYCNSKDVRLHLIPCPVKDIEENHNIYGELEKSYLKTEIGQEFPEFFKQIMYYDSELFKDELHFKDNLLTEEYKREIINKIKIKTGEFGDS